MVSDIVTAAVIAAVPTTLAALAALRKASKAEDHSRKTLVQSKENARALETVRLEVDGKVKKLIASMDQLIVMQREAAEARIHLAAQTSFEAGKRAEAEGKRRATDRPPDDKENT